MINRMTALGQNRPEGSMDGSDMDGSDKEGSAGGSSDAEGKIKKSQTETGSKGASGMDDEEMSGSEGMSGEDDSEENDEGLDDLPEEGEVKDELIRAIADEHREYQTLA